MENYNSDYQAPSTISPGISTMPDVPNYKMQLKNLGGLFWPNKGYFIDLQESYLAACDYISTLEATCAKFGNAYYQEDAVTIARHGLTKRLEAQDAIIAMKHELGSVQVENDRLKEENERLKEMRGQLKDQILLAVERERETQKRYYEKRLEDSDAFVEERGKMLTFIQELKNKISKLKSQRDQILSERDYWRRQAEEWRAIADQEYKRNIGQAAVIKGNKPKDEKTGRYVKEVRLEESRNESDTDFQCWVRAKLNHCSNAEIAKQLYDEGITENMLSTDSVRLYVKRVQKKYEDGDITQDVLIRNGIWKVVEYDDIMYGHQRMIRSEIDDIELPYEERSA